MKNEARVILTIVIFLGSISLKAQTEAPKCDYERYSNAKLSEDTYKEFNEALDNACKEINKGNYTKAINFLEFAFQKKEVVFVEEQIQSLREYLETSALTPQKENDKPQPEPAIALTPPVEPEQKAKDVEKPVTEEVKTPDSPAEPISSNTEISKSLEPEVPQPEKNTETVIAPPVVEPTQPQSNENPLVEVTNSSETGSQTSSDSTLDNSTNANSGGGVSQENTSQPQLNEPEDAEIKNFTEEEKRDLQGKGMAKVRQFEQYINNISSKQTSSETANQIMENALKLFYSPDDNYVEVSSKNRPGKRRLKVPVYLERLRLLNYDNVYIEWADLNYASEFVLSPDGSYRAYIISRQRFTAMKDNSIAYEDVVTKRTEIVIQKYQKSIDGVMTDNYDVFLGDISLEHTE